MHTLGKKYLFAGAMLLGLGVGQAIANGSETAPPRILPATTPSAMAPVWVRIVPVPGAYYYWVPQTGMAWQVPVMPQYAVPMPSSAPPAWVPFVWLPATAMAPAAVDYSPVADAPVVELPLLSGGPPVEAASAPVDYGPVADSPVIELPPSDETPAAAMPENATQAPTAMEADRTSVHSPAAPAPAPVSVEATASALAPDAAIQAAAAPEPAPIPVVPVASAAAANYGPVAPTPVVRLPVFGKRAAATRSRNTSRVESRAARKATAAAPKPLPVSAAAPAKKRLCWSNGVVAPCR